RSASDRPSSACASSSWQRGRWAWPPDSVQRRTIRVERTSTSVTAVTPRGASAVPGADDARLALEAQAAQRAGVEGQPAAERGGLLEPARGEDAQDVAVGEDQDVAVGLQ